MENDLINKLLKEISLETRFKVDIEMTFISLISDIGYRDNKAWNENNQEDMRILTQILDTSKELANRLIEEIKKWEEDGKPS